MSRTIKFAKPGGPEVAEFIEMEALAPRPHEVRIEAKAIASTVPNQCGAMIDISNP
jgi:NADPH:quinone reductase-like Zn-dependent oxidoreductase